MHRGGSTRYRKRPPYATRRVHALLAGVVRMHREVFIRYRLAGSQNRFSAHALPLGPVSIPLRVHALPLGPVSKPLQGPRVTGWSSLDTASGSCVTAWPSLDTASGSMRYRIGWYQHRSGFMRYRLVRSRYRIRVYT